MKKIKIKYNPFKLSTEILIDGKKPKENSALNFGKLRIQEWAGDLSKILSEECKDKNFEIEFTGNETDFQDLKLAIESFGKEIAVSSLKFNATPSVAEVEKEVDEIFKEILKGPVEKLRDNSILEAFKKAKDQEFAINVVATMSSGKSSLINALIDKKLMPMAQMATTATIVSIIDTEQDNFEATAYDKDGNKIHYEKDITYKQMKEWNKNEKISTIEIKGRIPFVSSVGMRLVLVDTPGPNNARDERHQRMTYEMLRDSEKSLVLFVMNGTQLSINDEKEFMDYVCDCMQQGGKQSRERFIFALNKMDSYNPEEEDIKEPLQQARDVMEERGILDPNIFPVSALAALECRTKPEDPEVLEKFTRKSLKYPDLHFESYYNFNNLPSTSRAKIDDYLTRFKNNQEAIIEIHTGIVSIEEAIALYINKYARALKVYDLVQSFNNRLQELAAIASLKSQIVNNERKRHELEEKIEALQGSLEAGQSAKLLSRMIDKKDLAKEVNEDVEKFISSARGKINQMIAAYAGETKIKKNTALHRIEIIRDETNAIMKQLDEKVDTSLSKAYARLFTDILEEYKLYLDQLGLSLPGQEMQIAPLDFVNEKIYNLDEIITKCSKTVDEGKMESKRRQQSYQEKKTNWIFAPWTWGTARYETRYRTITVEEWVPNNVEYVDVSQVVSNYLQPIQMQLLEASKAVKKHAEIESVRIKEILKKVLEDLNQEVNNRLIELKNSIHSAEMTDRELEMQREQLKWMEGIIGRVNKLIDY